MVCCIFCLIVFFEVFDLVGICVILVFFSNFRNLLGVSVIGFGDDMVGDWILRFFYDLLLVLSRIFFIKVI